MKNFSTQHRLISVAETLKSERIAFSEKHQAALQWAGADRNDLRNVKVLEGRVPGLTVFLASNDRAKCRLARGLCRRIKPLWLADPSLEFVHLTVINNAFETSDEVTTLSIKALSNQVRDIAACAPGASYIGCVELAVFANRIHPDGGKVVSPHAHVVLWGHEVAAPLREAARRYNARLTAGVAGCEAVRVDPVRRTWADLERVISYPYRAPCRAKTVYVHPKTGRTNLNESEKGDRNVRFLRMFQLLSLMEQDRLVFGGGAGVYIRRSALASVHRYLEGLTEKSVRSGQMDWVQDVWSELMLRLNLSRFAMPDIIVR